jgi:hypothetical protein
VGILGDLDDVATLELGADELVIHDRVYVVGVLVNPDGPESFAVVMDFYVDDHYITSKSLRQSELSC